MKNIILALGLIAPLAAQAADPADTPKEVSDAIIAYCEDTGDLAEAIMRQRQNGVRMSTLLKKVDSRKAEILIELAYMEFQRRGKAGKERIINEFAVEYEARCLSIAFE
ncbi:hypothetical protein [Pseudoponticoccus marisrubri]|uniref:Uncharacterized protein n=1 Tax=Pseudoponticoccus marisrubri TaxID=1685382 RepID=A0A0W7WP98_9RHOB|nr:hypothetical protein [Pseudoponticoccus marisrubri]KUF12413.1 hypothetical protein AVJ23_01395 [Pseudoponticoccus marisrubri]